MFVKRGDIFLRGVSLKRLGQWYAEERHVKAKVRLQCAILRKKGKSQPFIAEVTGKSISTVSDILRRFEDRGVKAKDAIKQQGQPRRLKPLQRLRLKKALSKSPLKSGLPFVVWTTKLVQYTIRKEFGVPYVVMQIHRLLKSMGLSLQKPRPEHLKANKRLQAKFKKKFEGELRTLGLVDMRSHFWTKARSNSNHTS